MGCCGGGCSPDGNNCNSNGHGSRGLILISVVLVVGVVLLIAKAVL